MGDCKSSCLLFWTFLTALRAPERLRQEHLMLQDTAQCPLKMLLSSGLRCSILDGSCITQIYKYQITRLHRLKTLASVFYHQLAIISLVFVWSTLIFTYPL